MKRYKFITIDIEGDISSRICRDNFTEDTLYRDPNTITWLCSFYNGKDHKAMGIRLPHEPRKFRSQEKELLKALYLVGITLQISSIMELLIMAHLKMLQNTENS